MHSESRDPWVPAAPESIPGYDLTCALVPLSGDAGISRGRARRIADGLDVTITALALVDHPERSDAAALAYAARLSRIRHAHVVRMHDVVPIAGASTEQTYVALATSAIEGSSLTRLIARHGAPPLEQSITLLCPLAEALHQVHLSGAVHGRLTTDAVWLTDHAMPLLMDLGIDEIRGVSPRAREGFDGCVAPEVLEGFAVTPESDVYALASLAWQVLTGEAPGWVGVRAELHEVAPDLPARICEALNRALSPEPDERPRLDEIVREFRGAGPALPIDLGDGDVGRDIPTRIRAMATRQPSSHRAPVRRRQWAAGGLLATCVVAALVVLAWWASDLLAASPGPQAALRSGSGAFSASVQSPAEATRAPTTAAPLPGPTDLDQGLEEGSRVIQKVLDARARAWESGDPAELGKAHAATSAALAADRSDLLAASKAGTRYAHVAFVAEGVEILDVQGTEGGAAGEQAVHNRGKEGGRVADGRIGGASEFTALVTVRRSPLTVITGDGDEERVDSRRETVEMTLRSGPDGWRLWRWG